jgi:hypothetical protein
MALGLNRGGDRLANAVSQVIQNAQEQRFREMAIKRIEQQTFQKIEQENKLAEMNFKMEERKLETAQRRHQESLRQAAKFHADDMQRNEQLEEMKRRMSRLQMDMDVARGRLTETKRYNTIQGLEGLVGKFIHPLTGQLMPEGMPYLEKLREIYGIETTESPLQSLTGEERRYESLSTAMGEFLFPEQIKKLSAKRELSDIFK